MNKYAAYFASLKIEVEADTLYGAKLAAVAAFKPRKSQEHMVSVVLTEKAGEAVSLFNSNADLG